MPNCRFCGKRFDTKIRNKVFCTYDCGREFNRWKKISVERLYRLDDEDRSSYLKVKKILEDENGRDKV